MRTFFNRILPLFAFLLMPSVGFSQIKQKTPITETELMEPMALTLISIIVLLILVIISMSTVLRNTAQRSRDLFVKNKSTAVASNKVTIIVMATVLLLIPIVFIAKSNINMDEPTLIAGISKTSFYVLMTIIFIEIFIISMLTSLFGNFAEFLNPEGAHKIVGVDGKVVETKVSRTWLERIMGTKSLDDGSEQAMNLGHDYDGIGELDNPTPPWWNWFFIISIVYGVVYFWLMHVSQSIPLQEERLAIANEKAEIAKAAYLAKAGNAIDESTVVFLDGSADIEAGKTIFLENCFACHGKEGEGGVGPNLVDDYWINGGSINDIFAVIKYGVPEKGMASWKDQYSPLQIAQMASFIVSIRGNEVANPKDPEGDLYTGD